MRKTSSRAAALSRFDPPARRRARPAKRGPGGFDGAVVGDEPLLFRYMGEGGDDRLVAINLAMDIALSIAPEPLLAPPLGTQWEIRWHSEDPGYGGEGTSPTSMTTGGACKDTRRWFFARGPTQQFQKPPRCDVTAAPLSLIDLLIHAAPTESRDNGRGPAGNLPPAIAQRLHFSRRRGNYSVPRRPRHLPLLRLPIPQSPPPAARMATTWWTTNH